MPPAKKRRKKTKQHAFDEVGRDIGEYTYANGSRSVVELNQAQQRFGYTDDDDEDMMRGKQEDRFIRACFTKHGFVEGATNRLPVATKAKPSQF